MDCRIDLAGPDDAQRVVDLIQACYQGTYTHTAALDPARVAADLAARRVVIAVARAADGRLAGTAALEILNPVAGVYGRAVVDSSYRGQGLFARLSERLVIDAAREFGLRYVHSCVVTNHNFAQRQLSGLGLVASGLLLGLYPDDLHMQGIGGVDQPVSSVQLVIAHGQDPSCRRLGLSGRDLHRARSVLDAFEVPSLRSRKARSTDFSWARETTPALGLSHLKPDPQGDPLTALLVEGFDARVVWVDVPATHPSAQDQVDSLRERGFCFGAYLLGVGPRGTDVVRMQRYQGSTELTPDQICMAPAYESALADVFRDYRRSMVVSA